MALRTLLWLRWRLTLRSLSRSRSSLVGALVGLLVLLPYALLLAGGIGYALIRFERAMGEAALQAGLLLIAVVWTLGPLLGFHTNDSQDITRLFLYPVPLPRLFLSAILGCLLELSTLLLLPMLLAAVIGATVQSGLGGGLVAVLVMPLFLFQTLTAGQAVTLALQGILQSRRWRDVALLIVPLLWMLWQFGLQHLGREADKTDWQAFLQSSVWETLGLFPAGLAARAVGAGMKGLWPLVVAYLGALGLVTLVTFRVSAWLVERAYRGESVGVPSPPPEKRLRQRPPGDVPLWPGWSSGVIGALFQKEWRLFTRDPYFRLMAMNFLYMLGFGTFMAFSRTREFADSRTSVALWLATSLTLSQQSILSYNIFGPEGSASTLLFAFPVQRRALLIGKNLANLSAIVPLNVLATTLLCVALKRLDMLALLLPWMVCASVLMAAVGNAVSVMIPYRVSTPGVKLRQGGSGGVGYALLSLVISLAALLLYVPPLAAVLVPQLWLGREWLWIFVPLALVYSVGLYFLSLRLTEPWLREREYEIVTRVARPDV